MGHVVCRNCRLSSCSSFEHYNRRVSDRSTQQLADTQSTVLPGMHCKNGNLTINPKPNFTLKTLDHRPQGIRPRKRHTSNFKHIVP